MQAIRLYTILLVSFFFSATADSIEAQTLTHVPLYTFHGDFQFDALGYSVSGAGDINGDGRSDLIVGTNVPDVFGGGGYARVLSGIDGSILYNFEGDDAGDRFGRSVSGAGDVNGDGTPDLIVGAPFDNGGNGNARVLSGSDGSVLYSFDGDRSNFGLSVSGAGDVNGDGIDDVIVGGFGYARVLSGSDGNVLYNFDGDPLDRFATAVSGVGDVNGDGFADLIIGAYLDDNDGGFRNGRVRVLSGSDGSVLFTFDGNIGANLGFSVSGAGDVNGDGTPDLIVGAPEDDTNGLLSNGSARVLSGIDGSVLYNFEGEDDIDLIGYSVSGAGDVNGDGFADLIIGTRSASNLTGFACVRSGFDGSVLYHFDGDGEGEQFGFSVSGAGDVNGDGIDDFIVGALGQDARDGGYARVFVSQVLGDANQDGAVDSLDILSFIEILFAGDFLGQADTNEDGVVSFLDIQPFINLLSAQ